MSADTINILQQVLPGLNPTPLSELLNHCAKIYPVDKYNPVCLSRQGYFILDGKVQDGPLDYIFIYKNEGDPVQKVPQHWHYIGFGLSDIHNYERLRSYDRRLRIEQKPPLPEIWPEPISGETLIRNGFGFELTFRVKCNSEQSWTAEPPQWPCKIMQNLAKHVFASMNVFDVGDHTSWHEPLSSDESKIKHLLMVLDPQMREASTSAGPVTFVQLVGVCQEELEAARKWNVEGITDLMREYKETGGPFLVTDLARTSTIMDLDPEISTFIEHGFAQWGSDTHLVSANHEYSSYRPKWYKDAEDKGDELEDSEDGPLIFSPKVIANNGLTASVERGDLRAINREETTFRDENPDTEPRNQSRASNISYLKFENLQKANKNFFHSLYLHLNLECARILPVAIKGRLAHKRAFSFRNLRGDLNTDLVPDGCTSHPFIFVSKDRPYAQVGPCLQIYISEELLEQMMEIVDDLASDRLLNLPKNYSWPDHKFYITIDAEVKVF